MLRGIEREGSLSDLVPIRVSEIEPNVGRGRVWVDKGDGRIDRAVNRSEEDQRAACAAFSTLLALLDVIQELGGLMYALPLKGYNLRRRL